MGRGEGELSFRNLTKLAEYFGVESDYIEWGERRDPLATAGAVMMRDQGAAILAGLVRLEGKIDELLAQ